MSRSPLPSAADLDTSALPDLAAGLEAGDVKGCCATVYEQPAVRWLLGGELHPGGEDLTRRMLELAGVGAAERERRAHAALELTGLQGYGLEVVEQVPVRTIPNPHNTKYLNTKREKLGHLLGDED